jgi:hypothetical protein
MQMLGLHNLPCTAQSHERLVQVNYLSKRVSKSTQCRDNMLVVLLCDSGRFEGSLHSNASTWMLWHLASRWWACWHSMVLIAMHRKHCNCLRGS